MLRKPEVETWRVSVSRARASGTETGWHELKMLSDTSPRLQRRWVQLASLMAFYSLPRERAHD